MARFSAFLNPVLVLFSCDLCLVRANRPPSPVNVTVTQLKANSATVSWDVPEGDVVIGYAILQQRQDGQMQRFIREVNTTNRACVLWDLAEDADYIIQVQSIGLYGESQASKRVHFRTLKETDRLPSNSSNQGDITMEGLDKDRQLQTGEIIIIVAVLLMWAAVIALFCRQYDIIKDNDSNNNKEKTKPSSEHSTPERPSGGLLRSKHSRAPGPALTVATILRMAAAAMSSPLGFSTSVMPRYLSVKHIPSSSGSCISAQLSGSSAKTKCLRSHVPAAPWLLPAEPPHLVAASLLPAAVLLPALSRALS
ncbi:intraflagellar transport protein 172 homolog isoform X11 [Grus americana]|uniref:intraflagellar transport protein 172 homolog isoform X11 n=1 Tax=Grus americana TaxID=9117 RepID=UPI002407BB5D|nr:intraflagellar transport protein 172 homolog isoform X11 [Grus americana]